MMYANAKYFRGIDGSVVGIHVDIDGRSVAVPISPFNRDYVTILDLVQAGNLVVADPDPFVPAGDDPREASIRAQPDRVDLLNRLKTATPAQMDTWVDNNVTNLAMARAVLKAIIKVIALDIRS